MKKFILGLVAGLVLFFILLLFLGIMYGEDKPSVKIDFNNIEHIFLVEKFEKSGCYFLHIEGVNKGTSGVFIGSSSVDLDPFLNKPVKLSATVRKDYGYPLCIPPKGNSDKLKAVVVDIESVQFAE